MTSPTHSHSPVADGALTGVMLMHSDRVIARCERVMAEYDLTGDIDQDELLELVKQAHLLAQLTERLIKSGWPF